jgi:hypothetical protein
VFLLFWGSCCFVVLGIRPRALHMLGEYPTTELHPQVLVYFDRVSLCSWGCPRTLYVVRLTSNSRSSCLSLPSAKITETWSTMPSLWFFLFQKSWIACLIWNYEAKLAEFLWATMKNKTSWHKNGAVPSQEMGHVYKDFSLKGVYLESWRMRVPRLAFAGQNAPCGF